MTYQRKEQIGNCTLYLGDCMEILPTLPKVDAVVTDPPYGVNFKYSSYNDSPDEWYELMHSVIPLIQQSASFVVMPTCGIDRIGWWYENYPPKWMLAWYKGSPGHLSKIGFNDWESHICWGKPYKQMHDYWQSKCGFDDNGHPCPKPIQWAEWLVHRVAPKNGTIIDPFMGSGTTGVACAKMGRSFIGIEIDEGYFDISCQRIEDAYRQGDMFITPEAS